MKKRDILLVSASVVVVTVVLTALILVSNAPSEVNELDMHLTVGDHLGFSVDTDAIYFGIIPRGAKGSRPLHIVNDDVVPRKVSITAEGEFKDWIMVSDNNFIIPSYGNKTIKVYASIPEDAEFGAYQGKLRLTFWKIREPVVSGAVAGDIEVNITPNGRINLTVNDTIGNLVASASTFVWNITTDLVDSGTTNGNGVWLSTYLEPGNYTVESTKAGYTTESTNVTVSINNITPAYLTLTPTGAPVLDASPVSISRTTTPGSTTSTVLSVLNTGDLTLNGVTLTEAYDWISLNITSISSIAAKSFATVQVTLGPKTAGTYTGSIFIDSSNDGNKTIPVSLTVEGADTPGGGGGGGAAPSVPRNESILEIIDYPENISILRGTSKAFSVTVANAGYVRLNNLTLALERLPGTYEVIPPQLRKLDVDHDQLYLVTIYVNSSIEPKNYRINLKARSDETYAKVGINLTVLEKPAIGITDIDLLSEILDNLERLIDAVWERTLAADEEGLDVGEVFELLIESKAYLRFGRMNLDAGNIGQTTANAVSCEASLKTGALKLSEIMTGVPELRIIPIEYMAIFGGALIVAFIFIYWNRSRYQEIMKAYKAVKGYEYPPPKKLIEVKVIEEKIEKRPPVEEKIVEKKPTPKEDIRVARRKLEKQLKLIEQGHKLKYISEEAYLRSKEKIESLLRKLS